MKYRKIIVTQEQFDKKLEKVKDLEKFRFRVWDLSLNLIKRHPIEGYLLLLFTWNFAYTRYYIKTFDLEKFNNTINKIKPLLRTIKNIDFKNLDLKNKIVKNNIIKIFNLLREDIKQTGATKVMALMKPDLFVMWDTAIRKMYHINNKATGEDYIKFLQRQKDTFNNIKWNKKNRTFAKAIDEFNFIKANKL